MMDILGSNRQISIARELTKIHETILRGSIKEINLIAEKDLHLSRGEIVIIIEGINKKDYEFDKQLDELYSSLKNTLSLKEFSKILSKVTSFSSKEIYNKYK